MRREVNDIKPLVRYADTQGWIRWHGQCKNCLKVVEQRAHVAGLIFCYELRHARWRLVLSAAYTNTGFCDIGSSDSVQCKTATAKFMFSQNQLLGHFAPKFLWEISFITILFWLTLPFFMFDFEQNFVLILGATHLWHRYNFCAESPVILDSAKHEEDLYWGWQVSNWCFN